jgi:hypothetical protein
MGLAWVGTKEQLAWLLAVMLGAVQRGESSLGMRSLSRRCKRLPEGMVELHEPAMMAGTQKRERIDAAGGLELSIRGQVSGGIFLWGIEQGSLCGRKRKIWVFLQNETLAVSPATCHISRYRASSAAVTVDEPLLVFSDRRIILFVYNDLLVPTINICLYINVSR